MKVFVVKEIATDDIIKIFSSEDKAWGYIKDEFMGDIGTYSINEYTVY